MNHSEKILKEKVKIKQKENGNGPDNAEKIADLKSKQIGYWPHESGPNADEPKNSWPLEGLENSNVNSNIASSNTTKLMILRRDKANRDDSRASEHSKGLNSDSDSEREIPASLEQNSDLLNIPLEQKKEKLISQFIKNLSPNLQMYVKDTKMSKEETNKTKETFKNFLMSLEYDALVEYLAQHNLGWDDKSSGEEQPQFSDDEEVDPDDHKLDIHSEISDNEIKQEEIIMMTNLSTSVGSLTEADMQQSKGKL